MGNDYKVRKCFKCQTNFFKRQNFKTECILDKNIDNDDSNNNNNNKKRKPVYTIHHESPEERNMTIQKPYKIMALSEALKIKSFCLPPEESMLIQITRYSKYKEIKIGDIILDMETIQDILFEKQKQEVVSLVNSKLDIMSSNFRPDRDSIINSCFFIEFVIISLKSDVLISGIY